MFTRLVLVSLLAAVALAQVEKMDSNTTTTTTLNRQTRQQTRTITLNDGKTLKINSRTLQRLENEGVDIENLDNLSPGELRDLGISLTETVIDIPGSTVLADGSREIRLRNGALLEIALSTLRRLQAQGVDVNNIPNMTPQELRRLGISVRTEDIIIPGAVQLDSGAQQITLANGIIVVIDQATLKRLQAQGVDVNSIPDLTAEDARRLGINIREDTIIIPGAIQLDGGVQEFALGNGAILSVTQRILQRLQDRGIDITTLPALSEAELRRLGVTTRVTSVRIPGATTLANGKQQIRLRNGVLVVIDQLTLRRLRAQGVNLNTLPNLSEQELSDLGISVTETVSSVARDQPIRIPGAVVLPNGSLQIRLKNGVLLVIDQKTLRRLQEEGVDLNTLPELSEQELSDLGISVTETVTSTAAGPIRIPGAITLPDGSLQIRLKNGTLLVIRQETLRRLQRQGVNLNLIPNMTQQELAELGIQVTETVTSTGARDAPIRIPGAVVLSDGSLQITLRNGVLIVIQQSTLQRLQAQGVNLNRIPNMSEQELYDLGIKVTETVVETGPKVTPITIPGTITLPDGSLQIRLRNGVLLVIQQSTLRRLQSEGVNLNQIPNMSQQELVDLGISVTETITTTGSGAAGAPVRIPGAVTLSNGAVQIRIVTGDIIVIQQSTLQRLRGQGVNLNRLPNMTAEELRRLGIQIADAGSANDLPAESPIRITGATTLPNGAQQIRLRNGVTIVLQQSTLRRLQQQGVNLNRLANMTPQGLRRLGIRVPGAAPAVPVLPAPRPVPRPAPRPTPAPIPGPIRIPGAVTLPNGSLQIRLTNGIRVVIDQTTLRRLQTEGVDLNTLPNLSEQELSDLGIQVTETVSTTGPIRIPGATVLANGSLQIRLSSGTIIVIDQATLRRLRTQGVNLNNLPTMSEQELTDLGIQVTKTVIGGQEIRIPGAIVLPNGSLQIRLSNGVLIVIDQTTLRRLRDEGVDLNTLPNLSEQELSDLGIQITETVTSDRTPVRIPGATVLPNGSLQIRLQNGVIIVIDQQTLRRLRSQGVNLNNLPNMSEQELADLGIQITETVTGNDAPVRIPGATVLSNGSLQIRLQNGVIVVIDQQTLRRLRSQGVDLNRLPTMSEQELSDLGIQITETVTGNNTPIRIPGTTVRPDGSLEIRLANGVIIVIDQITLRRLRNQGVNLNTLPNLTEAQLAALGIQVTETTIGAPIRIPGATVLPNGSLQIRIRNGVLVVIDQTTLRRLRGQGVNLNGLPNLSAAELAALGIQVTQITSDQPLRPGVIRRIIVDGRTIVVPYVTLIRLQNQGIDIDNLQLLGTEELIRLRVIPSRSKPRPVPSDEGALGNEETNPAPEPFNFAYTSETADGSSSSHEATQTTDGVVTGSYTIKEANGQERRVDYIADANGYRATVTTNEMGTESKDTADAIYRSTAPTADQLSREFTAAGGTSNFRTQLPDQQRVTRRKLVDARAAVSMLEKEETSARLTAAPAEAAETESGDSVPAPAESMTSGVQYEDEAGQAATRREA